VNRTYPLTTDGALVRVIRTEVFVVALVFFTERARMEVFSAVDGVANGTDSTVGRTNVLDGSRLASRGRTLLQVRAVVANSFVTVHAFFEVRFAEEFARFGTATSVGIAHGIPTPLTDDAVCTAVEFVALVALADVVVVPIV
jgi:hypothetical protein